MHRTTIRNLALLACAAAVAACGGQTKNSSGTGSGQQGQFGVSYVVTVNRTPGGKVVSLDGQIDCGTIGAVTTTACTGQYLWGVNATFSAVADTTITSDPFIFQSWAGDCTGAVATAGCVVGTGGDNKADKTVVAVFNVAGQLGHTKITDPAVHGAMYRSFLAGDPGSLDCTRCHGGNLQGVANAPSCASCHGGPSNVAAAPESCGTCHGSGPLAPATAHAITGKVATTVTAPVAGSGNLTFTVNVKVDGVNKTGLITPPVTPPALPSTATIAYRYAYNAARVAATVIVPNERFSLTPAGATVTDAGAGNYTVTIIGGAALTGNQTFLVRLQDAVVSPTMVYATAVTHLNGPARDLVGNQACMNCHGDQVFREREGAADNYAFHHGANPYGVEACVVCHTRYDSISRTMGGDRLTAYVHGVHNSHEMPARNITNPSIDPDGRGPGLPVTGPFTFAKPDAVYARNDSLSFVAAAGPWDVNSPVQLASTFSVGFPGYMINCATCHDTQARLDAVMNMPVTASTCFSCHDNWDGFSATKVGGAAADIHRPIVVGLASTAAANPCLACHTADSGLGFVSSFHSWGLKTARNGLIWDGKDQSVVEGAKFALAVTGVTRVGANYRVTWTASYNGAAIDPCNTNFSAGPVFMGVVADALTGKSLSNMQFIKAYAQGDDWVNANRTGVQSPGQPATSATLALSATNTACVANVATTTTPVDTFVAAGTKGTMALQGKPQLRFAPAAGTTGEFIQARAKSPTYNFVVPAADGAATAGAARRAIVDTAKCLDCHIGSLYQHGGNRVDNVDLCVTCHNPAASETNVRIGFGVTAAKAYDGKPGETYDMRTMIHAIHSAGETAMPYVIYRTRGIYLFGSQAAIDSVKANKNWPTTGGISCMTAEGPATYYKVFGSAATGVVPEVNPDGTCKTGTVNSADGTWQVHNEIVVHYPRALNDCGACHTGGSETSFGDQAQRMAVTVDAGPSPWGNQLDDVLRGAGAQSCTTCHQFGPTFSAPWTSLTGPQLQSQMQSHVNTYGFSPQAFPAGRGELVNYAKCGFPTCP